MLLLCIKAPAVPNSQYGRVRIMASVPLNVAFKSNESLGIRWISDAPFFSTKCITGHTKSAPVSICRFHTFSIKSSSIASSASTNIIQSPFARIIALSLVGFGPSTWGIVNALTLLSCSAYFFSISYELSMDSSSTTTNSILVYVWDKTDGME